MKLSASIHFSDSTRSCQVCAELELDNSIAAEGLSANTSELLRGLQAGIVNALTDNRMNTTSPAVSLNMFSAIPSCPETNGGADVPKVLPSGRVTAPSRKQRPNDQISAKQRKYLKDLLRANGQDLAAWCREKNTPEDQITAADCRQWIPELQAMVTRKGGAF